MDHKVVGGRGQVKDKAGGGRQQMRYLLVPVWHWRLLAHVVAGVGDTAQLPLADLLVPVHVLLDHLLQQHTERRHY